MSRPGGADDCTGTSAARRRAGRRRAARWSPRAARRRPRRAGAAWPGRRPSPADCPTASPPGRRRRPARPAPSARAGPPYAAAGRPPPITLPSIVRSGVDAARAPARRRARRGSPDHLVEDQQRAAARRPLAQQREEAGPAGPGPCWPGRARPGSRPAGAHRAPRSTASRSFQGTTIVSAACAAVTPGRRRDALRRQAGAGLGEQPVDVAVVGAGELDDRLAAGGGAREADRAHRRLGARRVIRTISTDGIAVHHLGGQLHLALGRRAEAGSPLRRLGHRGDHAGWAWPGSAGPTSRRSPRSGCRPRRRSRRPRRGR